MKVSWNWTNMYVNHYLIVFQSWLLVTDLQILQNQWKEKLKILSGKSLTKRMKKRDQIRFLGELQMLPLLGQIRYRLYSQSDSGHK